MIVDLSSARQPNPPSSPFLTLFDSFIRDFRVENPSPRTIEVYTESARQLHAFLVQTDRPLDPARITRGDVADFLNQLRDQGRSPATVRVRFSSLRRFFNWLVDEGELEHSPMARLRGPKIPDRPPEGLGEDELAKLFRACEGKDFQSRRDVAILRMFLDTGLRLTELANIRLKDLNMDTQLVRVVSKGGYEDLEPIGTVTSRELDRYLRVRAKHRDAHRPGLWLGSAGGTIASNGIYQMLRRRVREAGLDRTIHPHLFRHTFAHLLKEGGASDEEVQRLGRWRDRKMVTRYGAWAADQRAFATHRRLSPGDRVGRRGAESR
jgi:site-specific recombinase XerC